jgi:predicted site-specific integrase-resolvase
MRAFLKQTFGTESIEQVDKDELKRAVQGDNPVSRIKYRKEVGNLMAGRRQVVKKGEIFKSENVMAAKIDDKLKNENFGFKCLHYSVSEASQFIEIVVLNKTRDHCEIGVRTIDGEAVDT